MQNYKILSIVVHFAQSIYVPFLKKSSITSKNLFIISCYIDTYLISLIEMLCNYNKYITFV